eukprot:s2927_g11.t1
MIPLLNWRRSCRGSLPAQQWDHVFQQAGSVGSSVLFHNGDTKGACAVLPDGDHRLRSDRCGFERRKEAASDLKHCAALFGSDFMQRTNPLESEDGSAFRMLVAGVRARAGALSRRESGDTARASKALVPLGVVKRVTLSAMLKHHSGMAFLAWRQEDLWQAAGPEALCRAPELGWSIRSILQEVKAGAPQALEAVRGDQTETGKSIKRHTLLDGSPSDSFEQKGAILQSVNDWHSLRKMRSWCN